MIGSHARDLQHRLYARDETIINGRGVREGGGATVLLLPTLPIPLFRPLRPRAKWAVVQQCRPASACRSLFSLPRSDSSAYSHTLSRIAHSSLLRRARLSPCASTLVHTRNPIRARRRPTIPSVATLSRATSRSPTITTAAIVRPLSATYSWERFATFICPL